MSQPTTTLSVGFSGSGMANRRLVAAHGERDSTWSGQPRSHQGRVAVAWYAGVHDEHDLALGRLETELSPDARGASAGGRR